MAKRQSSHTTTAGQRALIIGVGSYPSPITPLPAVAADVREMAKLLASKHGQFSNGVKVLADRQATRKAVGENLRGAFLNAAADDTVFVYMAGHGSPEKGDFYFITHDTDIADLAGTAIPLTEIKTLFDSTPSRRVFLWLDFCHSGGILARRPLADDIGTIRRAIGVVKGQGKVIVAACTSSQSAYEDSSIGHGLFTDALLRGLRGEAKSAHGEVTAHSLYDFIDHQIGSNRQRPVFFGETTGRIVLMHYPARANASTKARPSSKIKKATGVARPKQSGTWVMLGDHFFQASSVKHHSDGSLVAEVSPNSGEDEAALASLRPSQYGGHTALPFAANNDAHVVRVNYVESETAGGRQIWRLSLTAQREDFSGGMMEMAFKTDGKTYSPDDLAQLRAGRILLNDPAPSTDRGRGFGQHTMLEGFIEGMNSKHPVRECVVRSVFACHGNNPAWKEFARLQCLFLLKATGTVEHVLELALGPVRAGRINVSFKGQRARRYTNVPATILEVNGSCPLG